MSCWPVGWAGCGPGLRSVLSVLPAMTRTTYAAPVSAPHLSRILMICSLHVAAPVAASIFDVQPETDRHVSPERREMPSLHHQHVVTR